MALGFPDEPSPSLDQLITNVATLGNPFRVFATEGIAYRLAESDLARNSSSQRLSSFQFCEDLSPGLLVLLHAGLGLALAESVLSSMDERESECDGLLENFNELCRQNARPGYAGVAFEALGLVAQTLYPNLVRNIDRCLSASEEALAYFWHGVGRGIYFAPLNVSPFRSAPWKAVEMCLSQPPHEPATQNAMSGFAWAFIAINLGQPEIMANFLKHHAEQLSANGGFVDGVRSAAIFWREVCPGEARLEAFPKYDPAGIDLAPEIWGRYIRRPFQDGFRNKSLLEQVARPEELFRFMVEAAEERKGA